MKTPKIVGIVNVTPDSFFDGGLCRTTDDIIDQALIMEKHGADWIDIGAESTRPGGVPLSEGEELLRLKDVLPKLMKKVHIPVSIDTMKASVAEFAIECGVAMVNDISALRFDTNMIDLLVKTQLPFVLTHVPWDYLSERDFKSYQQSLDTISSFFEERIDFCLQSGLKRTNIIIDLGIGFGKNFEDSLLLLQQISRWKTFQCPLFLGVSRKRFIRDILKKTSTEDTLLGSFAVHSWLMTQGIDYLRVHDVEETTCVRDIFWQMDSLRRGA